MIPTKSRSQISNFNAELSEATAKLDALNVKLKELNSKKQESVSAISVAKSKCDQFTKSDVGKLRGRSYRLAEALTLQRNTRLCNTNICGDP